MTGEGIGELVRCEQEDEEAEKKIRDGEKKKEWPATK